MDERSDQILEHIETQRDRLGENLNELESRVKQTTDWRVQFDRHPMLLMGAALGGGLLLGAMVSGSGGSRSSSYRRSSSRGRTWSSEPYRASSAYSSSPSSASSPVSRPSSPVVQQQKQKALDTLENIKAALISFGAARAREYMSQMIPGFDQHLSEAESRNPVGQPSTGTYSSGTSQQGSSSSYGTMGTGYSGAPGSTTNAL